MNKNSLLRLGDLGGPALGESRVDLAFLPNGVDGASLEQLNSLLSVKNGFYAFERALHVFPSNAFGRVMDIGLWNSDELWRAEYGDLAQGLLFFAEDLFGGQFCLVKGQVLRFDPETAALEPMADSVAEWATHVLADPNLEAGLALAHEWQLEHGLLRENERVFAKYPFVLGGAFAMSNLRVSDSVAGMRFLGSLARQLHDLPDGARVQIEISE